MRWYKVALDGAGILSSVAISAAAFMAQATPASAQAFDSYRCADGTHFILAFYPGDSRAYLQIDGSAVILNKSMAVSGKRYSGNGVSLIITGSGVMIRHLRRPAMACELS
jgi:membrane-bound inhibitor of C-type lysozyme